MITNRSFYEGLRDGVPIAIGCIPIAIAFGLLTKSVGIPNLVSILMSLFVLAGASQFIGVNLLVGGAMYSEIIITTFIINFRHFLMSASLSTKVENLSIPWRFLLSFGLTDETFTVASLRPERTISKNFVFGLHVIVYICWNIGTWIGLFMFQGIPMEIGKSMGIALFAMFIGLLIPAVRKSKKVLMVAIIAILIHTLFTYVSWFEGISTGWKIVFSTLIAAGIGAFFQTEEEKNE